MLKIGIDLLNIIRKDLKGESLWVNPNPFNDFNAATITLNDNTNNYSKIQVIYKYFKGDIHVLGITMPLRYPQIKLLGVYDYLTERRMNFSGTTCFIDKCDRNATLGTTNQVSQDNARNIPIEIIGYK